MILLDTCVVSEPLKPEPNPNVLAWIEQLDEREVYLPSLVVGELWKGIEGLEAGSRREAMRLWLTQLEQRFENRIVPFGDNAARRWGHLMARLARAGTPMPALDAQLAAQALEHGALLATRNTRDFEASGCGLIDPFSHSPDFRIL